MEDYLFVLGRDKELSLLELICYLKRKNISYCVKDKWNNFVLISLNNKVNVDELGGTIKIAKVILKSKDKKEIINFFNKFELPNQDKVYYTVNNDLIKGILSKRFKNETIKSYYKSNVNGPGASINLDLELINFKDYITKVIQVSNPKTYKKRDKTRPRFDEKKVTSVRLAKILINLSQAKKEIFDPFCGAGTILQEALLMDLDAYGLDINIKEAKDNLAWLNKNFNTKNKFILYEGDARNLNKFVKDIEAVVTEPYLGPYLKSFPSLKDAKEIIGKLEKLYKNVFFALNKITDKVVIIFPVLITKNRVSMKVNLNFILSKTKFKIADFKEVKLPISYKPKGSILEREIWIFESGKI